MSQVSCYPIIDRYCLAESKDDDGRQRDPNDQYQSGWRPWLCGPIPQTYDRKQNIDGTYHIRYKVKYLDQSGNPTDVWKHKGVKNIEMDEFIDEWNKARGQPADESS